LGSIAYNNSVVFDNEADLVMSNKNNHGKVFTTEQILGHSNDLIQGD
jgi:hypothetical protein